MIHKEARFTEKTLVDSLVGFLAREGYRVRLEVPTLGQSADLVATQGRWVTTVEAKLTDWRRAIEQCRVHQQVADYVCIAVANTELPRDCVTAAADNGYGVLHCARNDLTCRWILKPVRNPNTWAPQRRLWAKSIRAIEYAD